MKANEKYLEFLDEKIDFLTRRTSKSIFGESKEELQELERCKLVRIFTQNTFRLTLSDDQFRLLFKGIIQE